MPAARKSVLSSLKSGVQQSLWSTPVYQWQLYKPHAPFVRGFNSPWSGDAGKGRWIVNGTYNFAGEKIETNFVSWEPPGISLGWMIKMHGFSWLRDLKTLGEDDARRHARALITDWIGRYHKWDPVTWEPQALGERLANWIGFYDFFCASASEEFQNEFYLSLSGQARHLSKILPKSLDHPDYLPIIKGLAFSGLAFKDGEHRLEQALDLLHESLPQMITADGMPYSRNPSDLAAMMRHLIDIRNALMTARYPVPESLSHALDLMAPALKFFRHGDKKLALFHGAIEGNDKEFDTLLALCGKGNSRIPRSLKDSGFERLTQGRSVLLMDTGAPTKEHDTYGMHAAPLAFEFGMGRERIIVNEGTHLSNADWWNALRRTPAHTALTLDDIDACHIKKDGSFDRLPKNVSVSRKDAGGEILLSTAHDGYLKENGIRHRRSLRLSQKGLMLEGEDALFLDDEMLPPATHDWAIRFHLHPRVKASTIHSGEGILLRLPSGSGWKFHSEGMQPELKESYYVGDGTRPRKTQQIVLRGRIESGALPCYLYWEFSKEG